MILHFGVVTVGASWEEVWGWFPDCLVISNLSTEFGRWW